MPQTFTVDRAYRLTDILFGVAAARGVIGYAALGPRVGLDPRHMSHPLAKVSHDSVKAGGPMWSALCVSTLTEPKRPLGQFFSLARQLRPGDTTLSDEELWIKERDRCYYAAAHGRSERGQDHAVVERGPPGSAGY